MIIKNNGTSFAEIDMEIDRRNIEFAPGGYVCFFDRKGFCLFRLRSLADHSLRSFQMDSSVVRERYVDIDYLSSIGDGEYELGPFIIKLEPESDMELTFVSY